jgi:uracil-DNA glycosylase
LKTDLFDQKQNNVLGAESYAAFKAALIQSACTNCPLSESRTQIVFDRGNPEAKVMMIGEAPGQHEDRQGKVFVGRSGKLLDGMMKEIGFDTNQESIIINIVKCRPPENRAPKQPEVDACRPFLKKQIEIIKPRIILLLGAVSLKHMVKGKRSFSMKDEAGEFFEHADFPGVKFMVLFHPAYILRDPRKKPLMADHLKKFKAFLDKEKTKV